MTAKKKKAKSRTKDYYAESKRLKEEVLAIAEGLKNRPMIFTINKGFVMKVEITKTDLKTLAGKNTTDDKFNAIKNALLRDIQGYLIKSTYVGWRNTIAGKHEETAYFAYFNRTLGCNTYLGLRKMKNTDRYKPYAVENQKVFDYIEQYLKKENPPL